MKKNLIAAALLSLVASTSFAADNGAFASVDLTSIKNTEHGASTNAWGLTGGYRHFIGEKTSVEALISYTQYSTEGGGKEKIILPQVGLGYDITLENGLVLRPKVRLGFGTVKASFDDHHETATSGSIGMEAVINKNYSVEYAFKKMNANEYKTDSHQLSLNYKF